MAVRLDAVRRGMVSAFRVGWAVETNWASPAVNLFFQLLRPLGGAFILVFIYEVVVDQPSTGVLEWLVVGAAMWSYVMSAIQGISFAIIQEREWLRVLKYIVITPLPFPLYLVGRTATWVVWGTLRAATVLAVATLVLDLDLSLAGVDWASLAVAMLIGLLGLLGIGLALAGVALGVARHPFGIAEGTVGVLYLLSGAIFPPYLLPDLLQPVAFVLPLTYWLEAVRTALLPSYEVSAIGVADPWAPLVVTTIAWLVAGAWLFRFYDRKARAEGRYDRTTEY
ncbi:MAG TPA: ABC transporter permease [Acidimicrobiia bacterium]